VIGSQLTLQWQVTDDQAVESVDVLLSRTGPAGPWELLAAGITGGPSYLWTVTPPAASGDCWLRVDARDQAGNSASAASPAPFGIAYTADVGTPKAGAEFSLEPPAPNPATGPLELRYSLARAAHVRVSILDVQGREVQVLRVGEQVAGKYSVRLAADRLIPGLYFARLTTSSGDLVRRFLVVR
jgi:hypothetical protein